MAGAKSSEKNFGPTLWRVHLALVLVQIGYGGASILSKVALNTGVNPVVLAIYRDIVALAVLVPFAYFAERGQRPRLDVPILALLIVLGATGVFCSQILVLIGLSLASAGASSLIAITVPVFVFIISAIFGLEEIRCERRDGQAKVAGLISAVCGAVLLPLYKGPAVVGLHSVPLSQKQLGGVFGSILLELKIDAWQLGLILFFLAGLCYAIYTSLQVPILKRYPAPISICASAYFFGALILAITGVLTVQDKSEWVIEEHSVVISFVYAGLISSAANFAIQTWAVQKCGPVLTASYIPFQTFFTVSMGYVFLGETIHLGCILGTLFIITGLFLITWGQVENRRANAEYHPTPSWQSSINHLEERLLG